MSGMRVGVALVGALVAVGALVTETRADDAIVVVVESNHPGTQPAALRAQIARAGLRVVAVGDDAARQAPRQLMIVVHAGGQSATVRLRGAANMDASFRRGTRTDADWLAHDVAQLVASTERAAPAPAAIDPAQSEVLDPWGDRETPPAPSARAEPSRVPQSEVLDPWNGQVPTRSAAPRPAPVYVEDEVLDPWRRRPEPTPPRVHVEVLDPWAREPASELSRPRP